MARLRALNRFWAQSPPPQQLLSLLVRALIGVKEFAPQDKARADPWQDLKERAADPASGLAIRGKPPP